MSVTCLERHYGCGGSARGRIFLGALASAKYHVAMLCAYFDTNPFDNLLKLNRLAATDLAELRSAIRRQQLAVVSNVLNLQETIDALHSNTPEVIVPQLDLIASLIDWGRFVKPSDWLLRDDIKHFAWCGEPSSPFLRESVIEIVRDAVAAIALLEAVAASGVASLLEGRRKVVAAAILGATRDGCGRRRGTFVASSNDTSQN
jgi:hypothetical protein